jgi:hypothetical protein
MNQFRAEVLVRSALALSREELGAKLKAGEVKMGFSIVTEARWLDPEDWDRWTIVSQDKNRIRLVALSARDPGHGAFTRLIDRITKELLVPVLVEPNDRLVAWAKAHWYRKRNCGRGDMRHTIWYPTMSRYNEKS